MELTREEKTGRMKAQTFGVEIECNHIPRRKAAETIQRFLGEGAVLYQET